MDSIPTPTPETGTVGVPVKDAAGLTYWLTPKLAEVTVVETSLVDKIAPLIDPAVTTSEVRAYGMDSPVPVYDPVLANLMNLYVNIQLSFGAKIGSELYKPEYDVTGDGIINIQDANYVKQKITEYTGGK